MRARQRFRGIGGWWVLVSFVGSAGCAADDQARSASREIQAPLTATQIAAARQSGLIPGGYLAPTLFEPIAAYGASPSDTTVAIGINNAGTVVGFTQQGGNVIVAGVPSSPFMVNGAGQRTQLQNPSGSNAYAIAINASGEMVGFGGPGGGDFLRPAIYRPAPGPNGSYEVLPMPVPYWVGPPGVKMWAWTLNNVHGSSGLPEVAGTATYLRGGTAAVWHLDGDASDAIGFGTFTQPAGAHWVDDRNGNHEQAMEMDGSVCLNTTAGAEPDPLNSSGITMMAWVKPAASMCPGDPKVIVARQQRYIMSLGCNGTSSANLSGQVWINTAMFADPAGTIPFDQWSHIAVTSDQRTIRAYVNGVLVREQTSGGTPSPWVNSVSVGCRGGAPSSNFRGVLDEVSVVDLPLGGDQIDLFRRGKLGHRASAMRQFWSRHRDGFFDVLVPPSDPAYTGDGGASHINDRGQIVGGLSLAGGSLTAALYDPSTGWTNLNELVQPDSGWELLVASDINESGQIAGTGLRDGRPSAFRLDMATGDVVDLGHPTEGAYAAPWYTIAASDVNSKGHVAAGIYDQQGYWPVRAVIYTDELGLIDLNDLVQPASGWTLRDAKSINDSDEVVGLAQEDATGRWRGFRMKLAVGCDGDMKGWCLRADGVVDTGDGVHFVAVFGHNSAGLGNFYPTTNEARLDGAVVGAPQPAPPRWLTPGNHPGEYLPTFTNGHNVQWTVNGQTVTASAASTHLTRVTIGTNGYGVIIDGHLVTIKPDLDPTQPPGEATPAGEPFVGNPFNGTIPGELSISPSGAATYSVPIAIPPGIAGMAPNLSLNYNSQGGNGIAGQGWELGGLSMIHRCPKNRVQDGRAAPVSMLALDSSNPEDGLCLDGKRLFQVGETMVYKLESDDFSLITRRPDGTFTVETKGGETRYYGSSDKSRVMLRNADAPDNQSVFLYSEIAVWALDRVMDLWGNYYDVHYNNDQGPTDFVTEGIRVTSIEYTGHIAGAVHHDDGTAPSDEPAVEPFHTITFNYDPQPRLDVRHVRFRESIIPKKYRLTGITTPLGTYTLHYISNPTNDPILPSRLESIDYQAGGLPLETMTFEWDGGNYGWVEASSTYALPTRIDPYKEGGLWKSRGTQFVDVDGDGRVDLVSAKEGDPAGNRTWRSTGSGWELQSIWRLPTIATLVKSDGLKTGARLADVDGDGLADFITTISGQPQVWLNRIRTEGLWKYFGAFAVTPQGWPDINIEQGDTLADLNGDGRADLVHWRDTAAEMNVLLSKGTVGWEAGAGYRMFGLTSTLFHLQDVNRDGLADLISNAQYGTPPAFHAGINTGVLGGGGVVNSVFLTTTFSGQPNLDAGRGTRSMGDVDGDGLHDSVAHYRKDPTSFRTAVSLSTAYGYLPDGTNSLSYASSLFPYETPDPSGDGTIRNEYGMATMADLNADGLADVILNHADGGQVLINTGTQWKDIAGISGWQTSAGPAGIRVPVTPDESDREPNDRSGATFVDLDGNGVTDLVQTATGPGGVTINRAWINTFRPPVITKFPKGLARRSEVTYAVITTAAAHAQGTYADAPGPIEGTTYLASPIRVVASVLAENGYGTGHMSTTTYRYRDLRGSGLGRGPQGFRQVLSTDPSGLTTTTTYAQAYPYTGLPISIERANGDLMSRTETTYCDTIAGVNGVPDCTPMTGPDPEDDYPAQTTLFVYPVKVEDTAFVGVGTAQAHDVKTTTEYRYDDKGNAVLITVTVAVPGGQQHRKIIENEYEFTNLKALGKVTKTTVKSQWLAPLGPMIIRTTGFQYDLVQEFALGLNLRNTYALTRKLVEPDAGPPIELRTAYRYDRFGNVAVTTSCATDFTECKPGAVNSQSPGLDHLPFRTSRTSFDPADFNAPSGPGLRSSLDYAEKGRFPVKSENAAGHQEFTAYDPIKGVLLQKTGPNGIHTCWAYDALGRRTQETVRCGSTDALNPPLTTTYAVNYAAISSADPAGSKIVAITRPPGASPTWVYTDVLGRKVGSRTRSFGGGYVLSTTAYDLLGRPAVESKPYLDGTPASDRFSTSTEYDRYGRALSIRDELGVIDSSGNLAFGEVTSTYSGATVTTEHHLRNAQGQPEIQHRSERKNVIGKVEWTSDDVGTTMDYEYDAEGNLRKSKRGTQILVEIIYDVHGRKTTTIDADAGEWHYEYDGFGDLVAQVDAKGNRIEMSYDVLGRIVEKKDAVTGNQARWVYDTAGGGIGKVAGMVSMAQGQLAGSCNVAGSGVSGDHRASRAFTYNPFGDLVETTECVDGTTFSTQLTYDTNGRQSAVKYPVVNGSRLTVGYRYTSTGYLHYLIDGADNGILWAATAMNAQGQVTEERTRNGVQTISARNPSTGWLTAISSTAYNDGSTPIQNWRFDYDEIGNLRQRTRADAVSSPATETFTYDTLNRLKSATIDVVSPAYHATESYDYDVLGNLTAKAGRPYTYTGCLAGPRAAGPHAVCSVTGEQPLVYDANGAMVSGPGGRTIVYDVANRPVHMDRQGTLSGSPATADFMYGADGARVVQALSPTLDSNGQASRTLYVGLGATGKSMYERTTQGSATIHAHFIYAGSAHGGGAFAMRIVRQQGGSSQTDTRYNHVDHLGSIMAVSDEVGHVAGGTTPAGAMSYDAWGMRRTLDGHTVNPDSFQQQVGRREFTGHETISGIGLVNMNGRIYDQGLGRFLSPDPQVQFASDLQSYNRYSYVLNNPLRYTDPTGYSILSAGWDSAVGIGLGLAAIGVCAATSGAGCFVAGLIAQAWNNGVMISNGASFDQVVTMNLFGAVSGTVSGGGALALAGESKNIAVQLGSQILAGATSGAYMGMVSHVALGADLGESIAMGAAQGAAWTAIGWVARRAAWVSRASAAQGGGGSGESVVEVKAREQAAGRAANEAQWTQGLGSAAVADENGNPTRLVRDYSAQETQRILGSAVSELRSKWFGAAALDITIRTMGGEWDFKTNDIDNDTYMVNGTRLDSGQFGNYFVGYVGEARFNDFGVVGGAIGGEVYNMGEYVLGHPGISTFFDPGEDQNLISRGAVDAIRDYHLVVPNRLNCPVCSGGVP